MPPLFFIHVEYTVSSNALDFKMQLIIGGVIAIMSLLAVLYDEIVSEFDFVNKEQQPWQ